jgi:hypothetical protein
MNNPNEKPDANRQDKKSGGLDKDSSKQGGGSCGC